MQFNRGLKNFLIFLILISFVPAYATPKAPHVQRVVKGSMIQFTGWCLSDSAMAKIIADKEMEGARCQLKLDKLSEEIGAEHQLQISMLQTRLESVQAEYLAMDQVKTEQIEQLEAAALKRPNEYWYLFTAGGFVVGAVSVLGIWALVGK
jgi:hypothetical protein